LNIQKRNLLLLLLYKQDFLINHLKFNLFGDRSPERNERAETDKQQRKNDANIYQKVDFRIDEKANCAGSSVQKL